MTLSTNTKASPTRRWFALASLCLALFMVTLDNTVLNVVLPTLVRQLQATSSQLQWIVDAYVLLFAGLLLTAGSTADRVGRKRTFAAGMVVFLIGSVWAAYSNSVGMLIAARAFMGLGAAFINPSTLSLTTNMFTNPRERQVAFGVWAATSGLGIAVGPIVGGFLLAHFWWGSVFLINVPIALLSLACAAVLVRDSRNESARAPDVPGTLLSVAGLTLLVWAIIEAPGRGWSAPAILIAGGAGLALLLVFVGWEARTPHPMLDLAFFRNRQFTAGVGTLFFVMLGGAGGLFVVTQYLQFYLGYSPLRAGGLLLPAAAGIVVVAPLAAPVIRTVGSKIPLVGGLLIMTVGLWQFAHLSASSSYLDELPYLSMMGIGMGLVLPTATSSIMNSLPRTHAGVGSATNSTFMQVGTALGVALIGSVLTERYQEQFAASPPAAVLPPAVREAAISSLGGALAVGDRLGPAGAAVVGAARAAFRSGMNLALTAGAVVVCAATVLAAVVAENRRTRLRREGAETETVVTD